jgi:flagellar motor switch protein FliG
MARSHEPTGAERTAAFLLSLDQESAASLIKVLDRSVVLDVVEAMGHIDPSLTDADGIERLDKEMVRALSKPKEVRMRSEEELFKMLEKTLGKQQAHELFDDIQQRLVQERPFLSIENEAPVNLFVALEEEPDTVAALVLAHVDPALSAEVLGRFEPERSLDIVKRMATLIPPPFDTLLSIASDFSERVQVVAQRPIAEEQSVRLRSIAEVLNFAEPDVEKAVLAGIDNDDSEMASEIREFMFTWEDLGDVDKRAMQKILASVETRTLSIALKACTSSVENNILGNLSSRVREMVADERELAGAMPMTEVLRERAEVMQAVRALMEAGEFSPVRAGEDLVT